MKKFFLILIFLFLGNCSKTKTVLICGDHVCINKAEAEQFFEENLSLEVRLIDNKKNNEVDLVQLNLNDNFENKRQVSIFKKEKTNKEIKALSKQEVKKIKENIRKKRKEKKESEINIPVKSDKIELSKKNTNIKIKELNLKKVNKKRRKTFDDVCKILDKCSIDEISKYLIKEGRKKNFPDITVRQ